MEKYGLHESIRTYILWGLQWEESKTIPRWVGVANGNFENKIIAALQDQTHIGWKNLRRGFISRQWSEIQLEYNRMKKLQPKQWNITLIKWILEYSWGMWLERNQQLHGKNVTENREKRLEGLRVEVQHLYSRVKLLPQPYDTNVQQMFKLTEDKRKKKGFVALETWVNIATKVVEEAERNRSYIRQTGIDEWLNRTMTYQETTIYPEKEQKEN